MAEAKVVSKNTGTAEEKRLPPSLIRGYHCFFTQTNGDFYVHKDFICYHSPFFRTAFNGDFKEGETQKMELMDTCPVVFGTFIFWLYSQDLEGYHDRPDLAPNLLNLWVLADLAIVPRLQNQVMRILCGYSNEWCPNPKTLMTAYAKTSRESPMRKLLIKAYVLRSPSNDFPTTTIGFPKEIVFDIAVCLKVSFEKHRNGRVPRILPQGFYVAEDAVI